MDVSNLTEDGNMTNQKDINWREFGEDDSWRKSDSRLLVRARLDWITTSNSRYIEENFGGGYFDNSIRETVTHYAFLNEPSRVE
jgi:hypothetical protein